MRYSKRTTAMLGGGHRSRRGGVLALVVVAVLAVATLSASMLQVASSMTKRQASNTNKKLAFYMAETGLAEAYQGLSVGKTGNVGTQAMPAAFGNGLFWVEAIDNPDGTVTLDSTGMVGNGFAELSLVVEPRLSSVAALGVFADDAVTMRAGMTADGYDSGASTYEQGVVTGTFFATGIGSGSTLSGTTVSGGGTTVFGMAGGGGLQTVESSPTVTAYDADPMGKVGSNGDITLSGTVGSPVVIDGDAIPGPGYSVTKNEVDVINGSTKPGEAAVVLPPVTVPSFPPTSGIAHSGAVPYTLLPGQYQMPFMSAATGAELVIEGPSTVVVDQLQLAAGAALNFDTTGGPVNMYVNSLLNFAPGSVVDTSSQNAWEVTIQVPGALTNPALLAATADFYGILYAPLADVQIESPFEFSGSLVGKTLDFVGPVQLHYDQHLEEIAEELALPKMVSWRIVELSNPNGLTRVMDPFTFLGVAQAACPDPDDAHADQTLDITYEPIAGGTVNYSGLESAFDWTNVKDVHSISRDGTRVDPDGGGTADFGATMPNSP